MGSNYDELEFRINRNSNSSAWNHFLISKEKVGGKFYVAKCNLNLTHFLNLNKQKKFNFNSLLSNIFKNIFNVRTYYDLEIN